MTEKEYQLEIQELRRLLDLPPLEEQIQQYGEETQKMIQRIWKLYCKTCSPIDIQSGKNNGGRQKTMLDTDERFSKIYFERFLRSLQRYPESVLQTGLRMYLNSDWVGTHNFDRLLEKSIIACCNRVQEVKREAVWK